MTDVGDARFRRSRAAIMGGLLDLLECYPLEQITVRMIAEGAGVGSSTFYRHFPDRDTLVEAVATKAIDELVEQASFVHKRRSSFEACLELCEHVDKRRRVWAALLSSGGADFVQRRLMLLGGVDSPQRGARRIGLPSRLSIALVTRALIEIMTWWLGDPNPPPPRAVAYIMNEIALKPVERFTSTLEEVIQHVGELSAHVGYPPRANPTSSDDGTRETGSA